MDITSELKNARRRLVMAESRQERAETTEQWLADEATVEKWSAEVSRLEALSCEHDFRPIAFEGPRMRCSHCGTEEY